MTEGNSNEVLDSIVVQQGLFRSRVLFIEDVLIRALLLTYNVEHFFPIKLETTQGLKSMEI